MKTKRIIALAVACMALAGCTDTQLSWFSTSDGDDQRAVLTVVIEQAAADHDLDPRMLVALARCESGIRVDAHNPSGASGLFQFMPSTFARHAPEVGYTADDLWDPIAQAETAAQMIADGQLRQWSCASKALAAARS